MLHAATPYKGCQSKSAPVSSKLRFEWLVNTSVNLSFLRLAAYKNKKPSGTKRPVPLSDGMASVSGNQSKVTHRATPPFSTEPPSTGLPLVATALQTASAEVTATTSTESGESRKKRRRKGGEQLSLGGLSTGNGGVGHTPPAADECDGVLEPHVGAAANGKVGLSGEMVANFPCREHGCCRKSDHSKLKTS